MKTVYQSVDNQIFLDKRDCELHEAKLACTAKILKHLGSKLGKRGYVEDVLYCIQAKYDIVPKLAANTSLGAVARPLITLGIAEKTAKRQRGCLTFAVFSQRSKEESVG